jgi:hypothetical protein
MRGSLCPSAGTTDSATGRMIIVANNRFTPTPLAKFLVYRVVYRNKLYFKRYDTGGRFEDI